MWAMMEPFGQRGFMDELDGSKIYRLANILTLDQFLHSNFDNLSLWLESDDVSLKYVASPHSNDLQTQEHTYRICSNDDIIIWDLPVP
jgi:hypothetical protein